MMPQPGNVMTQVITMSLTTLKLMADRRFTAPTPIMAVVFVCVVLTGIPKMENPRRQAAPAISAEKPWDFSSRTISMPTDLMIFFPPMDVPRAMAADPSKSIHRGNCTPWVLLDPLTIQIPNSMTPMNFCPSCAPCINAMAAAPPIWAYRKNPVVFRRSISRQVQATSLHER